MIFCVYSYRFYHQWFERTMARIISRTNPTVAEYNALRESVAWPTFEPNLVEIALSNSLFSVVVHDDGFIIAMGRVVGDRAIYLHLQDVIVRPDFQRQGIGRSVMKELLTFAENAGGKNTNIGLMCSIGREAFYKEFGFSERPNEKFGAGMIKVLHE
jgi:predicted N-acetyltransferase YhbS